MVEHGKTVMEKNFFGEFGGEWRGELRSYFKEQDTPRPTGAANREAA